MIIPMRILHFPGNSLTGGVGSVIMNLYRHIDNSKYEFNFCFPSTEKGPFWDEITRKGGMVFHSPSMKSAGLLKYVSETRKLIVDNGPFDVVHVHSVHAGAIILVAAYLAGVKKRIYHVHNTQDAAMLDGLISRVLQFIFRLLIFIFATERIACGKDAGKYIYRNHSFVVLNNAIDLKRFRPYDQERVTEIKKSLGLPPGKIIVGNVFRFVKEKNPDFYLDLAQENIRFGNNCHFLLVGDGPLFDEFRRKIIKSNLSDFFTLTGRRSDPECMLNAMDVFTLPSFFEGLPVTAMEAQACGIPCVLSKNITGECVVLKRFCSMLQLSETANIWLENILAFAKQGKADEITIYNSFVHNNFEINKVVEQLKGIYCD